MSGADASVSNAPDAPDFPAVQPDRTAAFIAAVREGRVYYLPQDLFLLSPGIHYPEAVASMAKCLYPEAFE